jgi:acyl-CoA thioesterase FadM
VTPGHSNPKPAFAARSQIAQTLSHPARINRFAYVRSTVLDEEEHEENGACLPFSGGMRGCRLQSLSGVILMYARESIPAVLSRGTAGFSDEIMEATPTKTFHHVIDIYLKDSNAFMNTYFARYFEWQGICRERWFHECIHNNLLAAGGVFVTKRAHQEYVQETFPFQRVDCYMNTFQVRQCSAYLVFRFCVDGRPVSLGYQQILFAGTDKRIRRFPPGIIERVKEYELVLPAGSN